MEGDNWGLALKNKQFSELKIFNIFFPNKTFPWNIQVAL